MERGENGDANLFLANYTHLSVGSSNLSRGIQVVLTIGLILPPKKFAQHNRTLFSCEVVLLFSFAASHWRK